MRVQLTLHCVAAVLLPLVAYADTNHTTRFSRHILPANFKPPAVFENVDLVRNVNLERGFPKETINVVIKNIGTKPENEYYVPFEAATIANVGGFQAGDKNAAGKGVFTSDVVEYDPHSDTQFFRIKLPQPLQPNAEQTLSITYFTFGATTPLPAKIAQEDKQYLSYTFSAYMPSCYASTKQKTKLKLPSADIPDFTKLPGSSKEGVKSENKEDPVKQGTALTYGPFSSIPAGAQEPVTVRFEYTNPITHITLLERDIEVSHWGGNLAVEERYWLENRAAALHTQFNRAKWVQSAYYSPVSTALKGFIVPLPPGSSAPYFIDDVGNISTSRWSAGRNADSPRSVDLKPRYPIFGDWHYKFRIGWDNDLRSTLRVRKDGGSAGDRYILRVPFLEGPKATGLSEGIEYGKVVVRVILPEGAKITSYSTDIPGLVSADIGIHRTFMDTTGRTALTLTANNLAEELRGADRHALYVAYEAPAGLRKPLTIAASVFAVFALAWAMGLADVQISAKGRSSK